MKFIRLSALGLSLAVSASALAETCVTQSQMQSAERDAMANAARTIAVKIQAGDEAGLRSLTIADFQKNFSGIAAVVEATAPFLKGATAEVEQIYLLDAADLKPANGATGADAEFNCTLNKSQAETDFAIPQLPPGRYGFAMVRMEETAPWRLSILLQQVQGTWKLAGLYPKALTTDNHDGLWYWKQARGLKAGPNNWNAWLYLQEAQALLLPADFVSSTHLEKLRTELTGAAPTGLGAGLSAAAPLVVKGANGVEYRFTAITVDNSLGKLDVAGRLKVDQLGDAATARNRNISAMTALVTAHPELRRGFHGVWIFSEAPGQSPFGTEQAMADIH